MNNESIFTLADWKTAVATDETTLSFGEWQNSKLNYLEEKRIEAEKAANPFRLYEDPFRDTATEEIQQAIELHAEVCAQHTFQRRNSFAELQAVIESWRSVGASDTDSYWAIIDATHDLITEKENEIQP